MDTSKTATEGAGGSGAVRDGRGGRRRRSETTEDNARYFLPKAGSGSDKPELGQEMTSEAEALVQAFRSGQVFYTLVAWKAATEIEGNEPRIVKQALKKG